MSSPRPLPHPSPSPLWAVALVLAACSPAANKSTTSLPPASADTTTTGGTTAAGTTTAGTNPGGTPSPVTDPNAAGAAPAVAWPALDFADNPGGTDAKAIALSFDDGSDGAGSPEGKATGISNTSRVLDVLKKNNLKATFFICGNKWTNTRADPLAVADIKRMIAEGHAIGNHTNTHRTFDPNTTSLDDAAKVGAAGAAQELADNDAMLKDPAVLGASAPEMSMYRAPYGTPFQDGAAAVPAMAPATASHGVHVGWGIDTHDWECAGANADGSCILGHLTNFIGTGGKPKTASGVILMHSVYKLSADTLQAVIDQIKAQGYHFVMVEDFVRAKYGASALALKRAQAAAKFGNDAVVESAMKSIGASKWNLGTNED